MQHLMLTRKALGLVKKVSLFIFLCITIMFKLQLINCLYRIYLSSIYTDSYQSIVIYLHSVNVS